MYVGVGFFGILSTISMKFLSNFDTDIDTQLLHYALKEYDKDHVLLIKKHPIFLFRSMLWYILLLLATIFFTWVLLQATNESLVFEIVLISVIWVFLILWLFLVFQRYYKYSFYFHTHIHASHDLRSPGTKKLDTFIRGSLLLLWAYLIVFMIFEVKQITWRASWPWWISLLWGVCMILIMFATYQLIFQHIRYELDFLLITPDYVEHVYQRSFFSRKHRTVKSKQIRTIEISQDWLLQWLFHLGKATFVTDALDHQKDIYLKFDYIGQASEVKQKILWLLKK